MKIKVFLGFFPLEGNSLLWGKCIAAIIIVNIILWVRRLWEKERKLQWVYCRLYPFICWIIIKEGPDNFFGGRRPHWVNHVYLCLYCIVYPLCFISAFVLFYCSVILFFWQETTSWISLEKKSVLFLGDKNHLELVWGD